MTAPTAAKFVTLGPGSLKIGQTSGLIPIDCNVLNVTMSASKTAGTSVRYLCGTSSAGNTTYDYQLAGQIDVDIDAGAASFWAFCFDNAGEEADFEFIPNTADATKASGKLIVDPLDLGAGNFGDNLTSAFTFSVVGKPTVTYGP
jgi:hypothetical protein